MVKLKVSSDWTLSLSLSPSLSLFVGVHSTVNSYVLDSMQTNGPYLLSKYEHKILVCWFSLMTYCFEYLDFADMLKGSFYANPILDTPTTDASLIQR